MCDFVSFLGPFGFYELLYVVVHLVEEDQREFATLQHTNTHFMIVYSAMLIQECHQLDEYLIESLFSERF